MAAAFSLGLAAGVVALAVASRLLPPALFVRLTASAGLGLTLVLAVSSVAAGGSGD